jgi:hypothetical protein
MKLNLHCNKELEIRKEKRAANLDKTTPAETHQQADGRDTHAIGEMGQLPIARTAVAPSGTQYAIVRSLPLGRNTLHFSTLLIIMLGFALRLYALAHESLWFDELLLLDIAQGPLAGILPQLPRHTAVPLENLLSHFWILLGRQSTLLGSINPYTGILVQEVAKTAGVIAMPMRNNHCIQLL